jgi:hypothetical protein
MEGMGSPAFTGLSFCKYTRDPAVNRVRRCSSSSSSSGCSSLRLQ